MFERILNLPLASKNLYLEVSRRRFDMNWFKSWTDLMYHSYDLKWLKPTRNIVSNVSAIISFVIRLQQAFKWTPFFEYLWVTTSPGDCDRYPPEGLLRKCVQNFAKNMWLRCSCMLKIKSVTKVLHNHKFLRKC